MKSSIGLRFSRATYTYDREAVVQKKAAEELKNIAGKLSGIGIDLGCGTGFLSDALSYENIVGVDISEKMIETYSKKNKNYIVADIESLPFKDEVFNFVVSNFSLHWTDFRKSITEVNRVLKNGGTFLFSMPVKNSFEVIRQILGYSTFDFLSYQEVIKKVSEHFCIKEVYTKSYFIHFNNGIELLNHIKMTGTTYSKNGKSIGEKLKIYRKFSNVKGKVVLNFDVIFIKSQKL